MNTPVHAAVSHRTFVEPSPTANRSGAPAPAARTPQPLAAAGLWALSTLATLACGGLAFADPPQYAVTFLNAGIVSSAINESGDVVGTNLSPMRAWVSVGGAPAVLLPLPAGATSSWANDINDAGVIVGSAGPAYSPEFGGKAVVWTPDGAGGYTIQQFGVLPGDQRSDATAINNLGDIVGHSADSMFRSPVLFTAPGGMQDLSATGIFDPADINDQRVIVDHSFTSKRLDLDTMEVQDLGTPGPGYIASTGAAINESGQVAGLVILATSTSCDRQAARFTDEVGWEVFSVCGPYNGAVDINDHGDVVMGINLASYVRFEGQGTFLIESLIQAEVGHWYTTTLSPLQINNRRQLVVTATNPSLNKTGVLLLTPMGPLGDLDGDGDVDAADLGTLIAAWGPCDACAEDLDGDGTVDASDLGVLLANWT